jgi:putative ABC transport system substrate-binding protein
MAEAWRACLFIPVAASLALGAGGDAPAGGEPVKVAVVVSRNIRPYIEATEGLSASLEQDGRVRVIIFPLEKYEGQAQDALVAKVTQEAFHLIVAVGPEAARFAYSDNLRTDIPRLYTMVLNPEILTGAGAGACGVPLRIPEQVQIREIAAALPTVKRLGLLYDPKFNEPFFREAQGISRAAGVELVALEVSSRREIPSALRDHWSKVDGLWLIPDQTVISESIVQYIIKEALFQKLPVIGYNRFFFESGAVLAFILDYTELGRQAAEMARSVLEGVGCTQQPPVFHTWLNSRVAERLGIHVSVQGSSRFEVRP